MVNEFGLVLKDVVKAINKLLDEYGNYLSDDQNKEFEDIKHTLFNNYGVD